MDSQFLKKTKKICTIPTERKKKGILSAAWLRTFSLMRNSKKSTKSKKSKKSKASALYQKRLKVSAIRTEFGAGFVVVAVVAVVVALAANRLRSDDFDDGPLRRESTMKIVAHKPLPGECERLVSEREVSSLLASIASGSMAGRLSATEVIRPAVA